MASPTALPEGDAELWSVNDTIGRNLERVLDKAQGVMSSIFGDDKEPQRISTTQIKKVPTAVAAAQQAQANKPKTSTFSFFGGSALLKEFNLRDQVASGGAGMTWRIHAASRKSNNEEVSVWIFDKKIIDRVPKNSQETALEIARKEGTQVARLRHPHIIRVLNSAEESSKDMVYVTEPVVASLANVLGDYRNLPSAPKHVLDAKLLELEIKGGMLQLAEALSFLHKDAKMIHRFLSPESIFLTAKGSWKLNGFGFSVYWNPDSSSKPPTVQYESDVTSPFPLQPQMGWSAPELLAGESYDYSVDMFSLGSLLYSVFNSGKTPFSSAERNMTVFRKQVTTGSFPLENVPLSLQDVLKQLLSHAPKNRPDAKTFLSSAYFNDVLFKAIRYLDTLLERDNNSKAQFFKALLTLLPKFEQKIAIQKVLPPVLAELRHAALLQHTLPVVMTIAENQETADFQRDTLPALEPVMASANDTADVIFILLKHMHTLLSKSTPDALRDFVLPMVFKAYEGSAKDVQDEAVKSTALFADKIEKSTLRSSVLPRLLNIIMETSTDTLRQNALIVLSKILHLLDRSSLEDPIMPALEKGIAADRSQRTVVCILGVYEQISRQLGEEAVATKVLPVLCPMMYERSLKLEQFLLFVNSIKNLIKRIEAKRCLELKETERVEEQESGKRIQAPGHNSLLDDAPKKGHDDDTDWSSIAAGGAESQKSAPRAEPRQKKAEVLPALLGDSLLSDEVLPSNSQMAPSREELLPKKLDLPAVSQSPVPVASAQSSAMSVSPVSFGSLASAATSRSHSLPFSSISSSSAPANSLQSLATPYSMQSMQAMQPQAASQLSWPAQPTAQQSMQALPTASAFAQPMAAGMNMQSMTSTTSLQTLAAPYSMQSMQAMQPQPASQLSWPAQPTAQQSMQALPTASAFAQPMAAGMNMQSLSSLPATGQLHFPGQSGMQSMMAMQPGMQSMMAMQPTGTGVPMQPAGMGSISLPIGSPPGMLGNSTGGSLL